MLFESLLAVFFDKKKSIRLPTCCPSTDLMKPSSSSCAALASSTTTAQCDQIFSAIMFTGNFKMPTLMLPL